MFDTEPKEENQVEQEDEEDDDLDQFGEPETPGEDKPLDPAGQPHIDRRP